MSEESRFREHPSRRFAEEEIPLDLRQELEALRREPTEGTGAHRQKVIYKHGPATFSVFVFEAGGSLPDHAVAGGTVTVQVLDGEILVRTPGREHRLKSGGLLFLAPGVTHSVAASQPSGMLVTVVLENPV
jgi:quercetin dioxygenase-like cupin family protein